MHYHPETLLLLQKERQDRLEREAPRHALIKPLRRHRRKWWRRPSPLKPVPARLRPLLR